MGDREQQAKLILEQERDMMLSAQKVKLYDNSINYLQKNRVKSQITLKELNGLENDHRTYRPLGRGFILRPKTEITQELDLVIANNDKDIKEYTTQKDHFLKKTIELEIKLKESIQKYQASK